MSVLLALVLPLVVAQYESLPGMFRPEYANLDVGLMHEEGLSTAETLERWELRQDWARQLLLEQDEPSIFNAFLFAEAGLNVSYEQVFQPVFDTLEHDELSDFDIMRIVRYLFAVDSPFESRILEEITKIPYWLTKGESIRLYWSENHILMHTANAFLLRQKYGQSTTFPADPTMLLRLQMYLTQKLETGFFEYLSPNYMDLTLTALLNLYDFSEDSLIKTLAGRCATALISEFMLITNNLGVSNSVTGRGKLQNLVLDGLTFKSDVQEVLAVLLGRAPLISFFIDTNRGFFARSVGTLVHTSFDPSDALRTFSYQVDVTQKYGFKKNADRYIDTGDKVDRYVMQMSQGGYASPRYVVDLFKVLRKYDLFNHTYFKGLEAASYIPDGMKPTITDLGASLSLGSVVDSEVSLWKSGNVLLSSVNDYFPGYKGYQQIMWTATIGDVSIYTTAVSEKDLIVLPKDLSRDNMNSNLPQLVQSGNLLMAMYNPNSDLGVLGVQDVVVLVDLQSQFLDEYAEEGGWQFGRRLDGFFAFYSECELTNETKNVKLSLETHEMGERSFSLCRDKQSMFVVIVGTELEYASFPSFTERVLSEATVETQKSSFGNCVYGEAGFDGKIVARMFCRNLGNVHIMIMVIVFTILCTGFLVALCLRNNRNLWRRFAKGLSIPNKQDAKTLKN